MKYVKTFEDWKNFEIGDLVILDKNNLENYEPSKELYFLLANVGEIISQTDIMSKIQYIGQDFTRRINTQLLRLATPDEVAEYNHQKEINKYNI